MKLLVSAVLLTAGIAHADDDPPGNTKAAPEAANYDDGYCDYVQGVASAQSAIQLAPALFTQFGYIEQLVSTSPTATNNSASLRLLAGVRYRLSGIYEGFATRDRASADCKRHTALNLVRGGTAYRALEARAKVLDDALPEATKILAQTDDDAKAHRITAQESTATRLRVEELRGLVADTHRQMSALPPASGDLGGALKAFQRADAAVETYDGKLRFAQAFDLSVRFGVNEILDAPAGTATPSPFFAVAALDINLGALFLGSANDRAAAGRRKLVRSGHDPLSVDATAERLQAVAEAEAVRVTETAALEADLEKQLETLGRIGGDDSRRFRVTIWFDYIKVKAEHAYLKTHIDAVKRVLGDQ